MKKFLALWLLTLPLIASKTDDALAAAQLQVKAQALTIQALKKAVDKGNSDATEQRDAASQTAEHNAVHAEQAVSDQKENAVRVEAKTDAAVASAAQAAKTSESNNALLYASLLGNILTFLGVAMQSVLKYLSDGRILAAANQHQAEVVSKLDAVRTNTDGMTDKIEQLAMAKGHADERDGRTGD